MLLLRDMSKTDPLQLLIQQKEKGLLGCDEYCFHWLEWPAATLTCLLKRTRYAYGSVCKTVLSLCQVLLIELHVCVTCVCWSQTAVTVPSSSPHTTFYLLALPVTVISLPPPILWLIVSTELSALHFQIKRPLLELQPMAAHEWNSLLELALYHCLLLYWIQSSHHVKEERICTFIVGSVCHC